MHSTLVPMPGHLRCQGLTPLGQLFHVPFPGTGDGEGCRDSGTVEGALLNDAEAFCAESDRPGWQGDLNATSMSKNFSQASQSFFV